MITHISHSTNSGYYVFHHAVGIVECLFSTSFQQKNTDLDNISYLLLLNKLSRFSSVTKGDIFCNKHLYSLSTIAIARINTSLNSRCGHFRMTTKSKFSF